MLLLLGAIYNGLLQFKFEHFRYASVLGKIGMAWAVVALLYVHLGVKARAGVLVATVCGYWAMLHLVAQDMRRPARIRFRSRDASPAIWTGSASRRATSTAS